jgi:hypothetical protein
MTTNDQAFTSTFTSWKNNRRSASHTIQMQVTSSSTVSNIAERFSTLPWPYRWVRSGGREETRTANSVIPAAARSSPECAASASMPSEPVSTPTTSLKPVSPIAAIRELSAADVFSPCPSSGCTTPNLACGPGSL